EKLSFVSPTAAAILCRAALENTVNWLYDHDKSVQRPWRADLSTLLHDQRFREAFPQSLFREINLVRKTGNAAAHGSKIKAGDSLASLKYLFRFMVYLNIYYGNTKPQNTVFDETLIPDGGLSHTGQAQQQITPQQLHALQDELEAKTKAAIQAEEKLREQIQSNATLKTAWEAERVSLAALKLERQKAVDFQATVPLAISEAETRKRYIDLSLQACGWDHLREGRELEHEVTGMPKSTNPSGLGYVDYVLWGDDGLPLAVVEAKKTMADARKGKHQATLYADCLEAKHGQRPIIFYSNGFETYLWDDQFYPEREVQGFYDKNELQLMIQRRGHRTDLRDFKVNEAIAGRAYQLEAIQRIAENFASTNPDAELRGRARQSLLVMATGSGKTRTAAAIVDMLTKCNWAKRVLFLADRNALVRQAQHAFNEHLPHLSTIDLTKEREDNGTRLVFSTYPTIMNRIDGFTHGDQHFYGVGHFDLIIVDEAHRSVYQKYGAIFEYFDAMLVGLTATPKTDIDHNTYGLFGIEDDNPTFAYELDTAVREGHLVPPKAVSVPLQFMREGIKYEDLSESEKAEYEEKFGDPSSEEVADEISSSALNSWLFNTDTVDKVLHHLMVNGIKVQGGDKLGKSIIFAKNHAHAIFIEQRFNKNYPEYAGKFLRVIDNYASKAQDLLEVFVEPYAERDPQIAVSVDMMDTGVDAPRVVNLVFFKPVKSPTKFWQMIGRGTRLCPNLFGIGQDKQNFAIFDFCQNFEFFNAFPDGLKSKTVKSLTQQTFEAKLEIAVLIREQAESTEQNRELAESYIHELQQAVAGLDQDRFVVKAKLRHVIEYSDAKRWQSLSKGDMLDIHTSLSSLVLPHSSDDEFARRFDVLLLRFQLAILTHAYSTDPFINKISSVGKDLLTKLNIPEVAMQAPLLHEVQTEAFWQLVHVNRLDEVRLSLRDLMKYLDKEKQGSITTNFEDELDELGVTEHDLIPSYSNLQSYKDRVESYVRHHKEHVVIQKLKRNKPITVLDLHSLERILFDGEVGSKQDYINTYGDKPLGEFIRGIVGLDKTAVQDAFAAFIQAGNLRADQITFINTIIEHLSQNGTIDQSMLFESPFTFSHHDGLLGVFDDAAAEKVIQLIDRVHENALISASA
ncbi:MAG: DEAD/DEAH box helicase family protein, partial [Mariprofundaceae bacterium]|nr:DEAD/DEAH box helicase family protein [Mariprofundaceae bacterium]